MDHGLTLDGFLSLSGSRISQRYRMRMREETTVHSSYSAKGNRAREPPHPARGRLARRGAEQRGAQGRDLPRGAWTPRGSHSRRHPARGLDERAGPRPRAPRCRREAAPVVTVATRKWRRGLARASRGLEEPRTRGPARRHTARSRDSPFRCSSSSESR